MPAAISDDRRSKALAAPRWWGSLARWIGPSVGAVLAWTAPAEPVAAQLSMCAEYEIGLEREVVLGSPDDEGTVGEFETLVASSDGCLFLRHFDGTARVWVFDSTGAPAGYVGEVGEGPGEYIWPVEILWGPGDSLHVFDSRQQRHLVYAADLNVARTTRLPFRPHVKGALSLGGADWLLNATVSSRDLYGLPIHVVRETDGVEVVLARDDPRFLPWNRGGPAGPENPPKPYVADIHTDPDGFLWVLARWRPVDGAGASGEGPPGSGTWPIARGSTTRWSR